MAFNKIQKSFDMVHKLEERTELSVMLCSKE